MDCCQLRLQKRLFPVELFLAASGRSLKPARTSSETVAPFDQQAMQRVDWTMVSVNTLV